MDLKPVELQIAVPRTSEASRIHQDQQSRPQLDQQQLAGQNIRSSEQQRMRSNQVDESSQPEVREEAKQSSSGNQGHQRGGRRQERSDHPNQSHPAEHPFKGKHIDFSL
ncbi:hypothetical protein [Paenibacillus caui]|uniref:hypothetical protein n=1 Tax=Paenibacillus caui TaxID=2873927 RepID=UPI001CA94A46|nr:hypothetical protein [Paenibacillus caui]